MCCLAIVFFLRVFRIAIRKFVMFLFGYFEYRHASKVLPAQFAFPPRFFLPSFHHAVAIPRRALPLYRRVIEPSAWVKAWKIRARFSFANATPVSRMEKWELNASYVSEGEPIPSVKDFAAFAISGHSYQVDGYLAASGTNSPIKRSGICASTRHANSRDFCCARDRRVFRMFPRSSRRENSASSRLSFPASIFEKSRMSFRSSNNESADASLTIPKYARCSTLNFVIEYVEFCHTSAENAIHRSANFVA